MAQSMHDVSDPRNQSILINVNGELKPRPEAVVSVFDSGFMLGDGVWEGLRLHGGKLGFLDRHLDRLFEGAKAIAMENTTVQTRTCTANRCDTRSIAVPNHASRSSLANFSGLLSATPSMRSISALVGGAPGWPVMAMLAPAAAASAASFD